VSKDGSHPEKSMGRTACNQLKCKGKGMLVQPPKKAYPVGEKKEGGTKGGKNKK